MKRKYFTAALSLAALLVFHTAKAQTAAASQAAVDTKVAPADNKQHAAPTKPAEARPVQPLGSFVKSDNPQPVAITGPAAANTATATATAAAATQFNNQPVMAPAPQPADKPRISTIPADPNAMPAMPPSIPFKQ